MFKSKKYIGFDDTWLMIVGIPIVTVLVTIMIFGIEGLTDFSKSCLPLGFIYTTAYWLGFRYVTINYHRSYPDYNFNHKRLFYVISRMSIMYITVKVVMGFITHRFFPDHVLEQYDHLIKIPVIAITMIALGFFLYEGIYYFNRSRIIEIEKNKLQKALLNCNAFLLL